MDAINNALVLVNTHFDGQFLKRKSILLLAYKLC